MNRSFWKDKKVFITGHTGFKGSWLSLWLQYLGAKVVGYSLEPPTNPSLYVQSRLEEFITSHYGDIRDYPSLVEKIIQTGPDVVFHLAAQPLVGEGYRDPINTYSTNVMGTVHLLEAIRNCESVKVVINVTTDKCYENKEWIWGYRESDQLGGKDPYSNSKGCAELVTKAFRESYFSEQPIEIATVRAGNVIGGGDWSKDRIVPDIISSLCNQTEIDIRNPQAIRPWQHVLDALYGYILLAEKMYFNKEVFVGAWNFGPSYEQNKTVMSLVNEVILNWKNVQSQIVIKNPKFVETSVLTLDSTKARVKLGWKPKLNFEEAIRWTVEWYYQEFQGMNMRAVTLAQISEFMQKMNDRDKNLE